MKTYCKKLNETESSITLVAFGGIANQLMIPVFEFFNILKKVNCNKLFIKDDTQSWYYGIGYNTLLQDLKNNIDENDYKIFIGTSAGGYAAILTGYLAKADLVLSFAPQTFLDKIYRKKYSDSRWPLQIKKVHNLINSPKELRLENIIKDNGVTKYSVYYCTSYKLDVIHAERLSFLSSVRLLPQKCNIHPVVSWLNNNNLLESILKGAVNGISS